MAKQVPWKRHIVRTSGCFVVFWITDALIDALSFGSGPFYAELFSGQPREIYMRTVVSSVLSLFILAIDILGERKRSVELALKQSDELAGIFFNATSDAVCTIDAASMRITEANPIFLHRYALSPEDLVEKRIDELVTAGHLPEEMLDLVRETAAGGTPLSREVCRTSGGALAYEELVSHPIGDAQQGRVLQVARDITLRRYTEGILKDSEAKYRSIFDNAGSAMAVVLADGTLHMVNRGFEGITGFSRDELEGKKRWSEFVVGGAAAVFPDGVQSGGSDGQGALELETVDRFGAVKAMAGNWSVITGSGLAVLSLVDISTRKKAEQALRESQATLGVAHRIAAMGNWEWDVTTNTVTWSDEMYRMFGLDSAQFTPSYEAFLQAVHPDDREAVIRSVNDALYNKKPFNIDYRLVQPGGAVRTHTGWAEVTYDGNGNPLRMIGTNQDISWRVEAEQALRTSEEKFSKAFQASPDSIVITRAQDGMYIDVNEAFQQITGYTRQEVLGKTSVELQLWADPDARMVMLRLLNQFGHVRNLDVRFRVKSGEIREMLWSAEVIEYGGEACLIAIARDVTDQRHLERELLESEARLFMKHEELKNLFHQMESIRREWEETMDCISDMFILTDQWGKIRRFNRAVETFTGMAHRDIVGREWLPFLEEHGLKPHLEAPGVELPHKGNGKRYVLNRYAFPTAEVDGSTRQVIIIYDTSAIRLRHTPAPLRLAGSVREINSKTQ